jgi:hypothetical protein
MGVLEGAREVDCPRAQTAPPRRRSRSLDSRADAPRAAPDRSSARDRDGACSATSGRNRAVDHGCGDDLVAEDLVPGGEGFVAGDDQARSFVTGADERERQVGRLRVEEGVADLLDDQERDPLELAQLVGEPPLPLGVAEPADSLGRGREGDAVAGEAGADPQRDRQVRFSGAGRARVVLLMLSIRCRSASG